MHESSNVEYVYGHLIQDNKEEEESSGEAESQEEQSKEPATEESKNDSGSEDDVDGQDEVTYSRTSYRFTYLNIIFISLAY